MEDASIGEFFCPVDGVGVRAQEIIPELRHPFARTMKDSMINEVRIITLEGASR